MIRSGLAPRRRLRLAHARRSPHAALLVHREAVDRRLAVPDRLVAPVRGRRGWRLIRGARRVRIARADLDHARGVRLRIDDRQVVAALFERAVDRSVGVDRRVPLVGRDRVVQIDLRVRPIPHRHDDVALDALRARRRRGGQLALGDAVGPVGIHRERAGAAHLREAGAHAAAGLAGLDAAIPRHLRVLELAEDARGNRARGRATQLVAAGAAVGVDDVADPLALALDVRRDAVALVTGAGEIALGRQLQQREPVERRVVLRGGLLVGRRRRLQVDDLSRLGLHLRRVDQPVAADPHVVLACRQVGDDVPAAVVGDDALDQARRCASRFRDHPDAGLGAIGARDHAANIVVINARGRASLARHADRGRRQKHYEAQPQE